MRKEHFGYVSAYLHVHVFLSQIVSVKINIQKHIAKIQFEKKIELTTVLRLSVFQSIISSETKSIWNGSLTRAGGERWRYLRSTFSPTFSSGKMRHVSNIYIYIHIPVFLAVLQLRLNSDCASARLISLQRAVRG